MESLSRDLNVITYGTGQSRETGRRADSAEAFSLQVGSVCETHHPKRRAGTERWVLVETDANVTALDTRTVVYWAGNRGEPYEY